MNKFLLVLAAGLAPTLVFGQTSPGQTGLGLPSVRVSVSQPNTADPIAALVRPLIGAPIQAYIPTPSTMVANRAKVLGTELSGSGSRYISMTSTDLAGKTPQQIRELLTPEVTASPDLRRLEINVDLRNPVTIQTSPGQPAGVGATVIRGNVRNLDIRTNIRSSGVTITTKPHSGR